METVIQCRELTKTYLQGGERIIALDKVSLDFHRGDFIAVAGPSGSGKTTLLNLLGLLDTPDHGEVALDGQSVDFSGKHLLTKLRGRYYGFIFQKFNLIPVLTAKENVEVALMEKNYELKAKAEMASRALELVDLSNRETHYPRQLSGGQQQRVAIARALVDNPSIIFADEPTANLDSATAASILELLKDICRKFQTTVIVSTHDPKVVACANRRIDLKDGRVVEEKRI